MHIVGELKTDFRSYRRLVLPAFGRAFPITRVLALVAAIWMGVQLLIEGYTTTRMVIVVGCILGIALPELTVLVGWLRTARSSQEPWRYVVTDSTVGIDTPESDFTTRWDAIAHARTQRHVWLLRLANRALVPVPRAAFTADEATQIDALVASAGARSR